MSLIGLLEALDYSRVDVDLFVYRHTGELMGMIPPQVHLLPEIPEYAQIERPMKEVIRDGYLRIALARLTARVKNRRFERRRHPRENGSVFSFVSRQVVTCLPEINPGKEYDLAVSFLTPHDFVLKKVRAGKKAAWIHSDYSYLDIDAGFEFPVWSSYDRIAAISESVKRSFLSVFPSLEDRVVVIPNLLPAGRIATLYDSISVTEVEREMPRVSGRINLLSVGRFCHAKNYDNVPDICRRLRDMGADVSWFLIGYGTDEALIRSRIEEEGMGAYVRILGKKDNPLPYIKACDLYVQPSRYEGVPVTVREAQALGKPVAVTAFGTADSVITCKTDGAIVPIDNEGCAEGLARLIADPDFMKGPGSGFALKRERISDTFMDLI